MSKYILPSVLLLYPFNNLDLHWNPIGLVVGTAVHHLRYSILFVMLVTLDLRILEEL